jgi:C1A family cysteine protease
MKTIKLLFVIGLPLVVVVSCHKEYSSESLQQIKIDSLPFDYPFATGYCEGVSLGISIADTSYYLPDTAALLPSSILLDMPTPGDQGSQGSCTAWATVYGVGTYYAHINTGKPYSDTGNLSPKFTYNQITKGNCTCTSFLDNLYLLKTQGACALGAMSYDPNECSKQPDSAQKNNAQSNAISGWRKLDVHNLTLIKRAVLNKKPVLFAINTDEGFNTIASPYIWQARIGPTGQPHAMIIVGYDDSKKALRIMNSWSTAWGENGFAWINYDFFIENVLEGGHVVI